MRFSYIKRIPQNKQAYIHLKPLNWAVGHEILYYLDNPSEGEKSALEAVLKEISYICNISFKEVERNLSEIRIGFVRGIGSWSTLGTDALRVIKGQNTMNFGWDVSRDSGVIRHEIGHALGLLHEHLHPNDVPQWNKEVIYSDLARIGWSKEQVDFNLFEIPEGVTHSSFRDRNSVMHYIMPASWTFNNAVINKNEVFSANDIIGLQKLYPNELNPIEIVNKHKEALKTIYNDLTAPSLLKSTHKRVAYLVGVSTEGKERTIIHNIKTKLNV